MDLNQNDRSGATLHDVAREAGVSLMTASRVVNGREHVSAKTRAKVLHVVQRLNYQVNVAARVARVGTLRIGLVYSNPSPAFENAFLAGATGQCSLNGAELVLQHCQEAGSEQAAVEQLMGRELDGVLVPAPLCDSLALLQQLERLGVPIVAVASACPALDISAVRIDDYEGARSMTEYLLSLGHTDIAFIQGDPAHTPAQLRYKAFMDVMREAGLAVPESRIAPGMFTYRSGLEAARALLAQPSRPSAIFACNDDMAAATVAVAHGLHLRLPEDLSICGFDDTPVASAIWPALTTIHQPIGAMARNAVDLVVEQIRERRAGRLPKPQHRLMPYALQARESTSGLARAAADR